MQQNRSAAKIMGRSMVIAALSAGLLLTGCNRPQFGPPPPSEPEVAIVTIQPEEVMLTTELPGRTSAFRIAEIRPRINGLIQKRLFTEGSDVKAGDMLYQIDPAPFQAALDSAAAALSRSEANLKATRLNADRLKSLLADKAVSQQDYDNADAALKQTQADIEYYKAMVKSAEINLGYCSVRAPISGRIGRSGVTDGALVTAYQPASLASIQQLDPIYVDVPQSTAELLRLKRRLEDGSIDQDGAGQDRVNLVLDDGVMYPLEGTLQFHEVTVDQSSGTVILRVVFPNPENTLLPGMFVRAVVKEGKNTQAILVPQQAVFRDPKGTPFALLVDAEGKVQKHMLTIDRAIGDKWLVAAGLSSGDRVIVEGIQRVRPGMTVKALPFNEDASGSGPAAVPGAPNQEKTDGGA